MSLCTSCKANTELLTHTQHVESWARRGRRDILRKNKLYKPMFYLDFWRSQLNSWVAIPRQMIVYDNVTSLTELQGPQLEQVCKLARPATKELQPQAAVTMCIYKATKPCLQLCRRCKGGHAGRAELSFASHESWLIIVPRRNTVQFWSRASAPAPKFFFAIGTK